MTETSRTVAADTGAAGKAAPRPSTAGAGRGSRPGWFARLRGYVREVVAELRKVIWPTRKELINYTIAALVFVTAMALILAGLDLLFAAGVLKVFG